MASCRMNRGGSILPILPPWGPDVAGGERSAKRAAGAQPLPTLRGRRSSTVAEQRISPPPPHIDLPHLPQGERHTKHERRETASSTVHPQHPARHDAREMRARDEIRPPPLRPPTAETTRARGEWPTAPCTRNIPTPTTFRPRPQSGRLRGATATPQDPLRTTQGRHDEGRERRPGVRCTERTPAPRDETNRGRRDGAAGGKGRGEREKDKVTATAENTPGSRSQAQPSTNNDSAGRRKPKTTGRGDGSGGAAAAAMRATGCGTLQKRARSRT